MPHIARVGWRLITQEPARSLKVEQEVSAKTNWTEIKGSKYWLASYYMDLYKADTRSRVMAWRPSSGCGSVSSIAEGPGLPKTDKRHGFPEINVVVMVFEIFPVCSDFQLVIMFPLKNMFSFKIWTLILVKWTFPKYVGGVFLNYMNNF